MSPLRPLTVLLALCLSSSLQAHPVVGDPARYVSTTLAVQGAVEEAQSLDLAALRQLVQRHPASVTLKRQPDGSTRAALWLPEAS